MGSATTLSTGAGSSNGTNSALSIKNLMVPRVSGVVPEPATWALMILGFGLIAVAMRQREAKGAIAAA